MAVLEHSHSTKSQTSSARKNAPTMRYGFTRKLSGSLGDALERTRKALHNEGFVVLHRFDLHERLQEHLDIRLPPYVILSVYNPLPAYKAIQVDENIGLMVPCNVILYEKDNQLFLGVIRPIIAMTIADNQLLQDIATELTERLEHVVNAVAAGVREDKAESMKPLATP